MTHDNFDVIYDSDVTSNLLQIRYKEPGPPPQISVGEVTYDPKFTKKSVIWVWLDI